MPHGAHEQTINTALGEILEELGQGWAVNSEEIGRTFEDGGRPDILILKPDGWPIVIEAEVGNHRRAEIDAQVRLGNRLIQGVQSIDTAVALVYPPQIRIHTGQALRRALETTVFEYALFSSEADAQITRFPVTGWLSGDLVSLALLLHRSGVPAWRIKSLKKPRRYA